MEVLGYLLVLGVLGQQKYIFNPREKLSFQVKNVGELAQSIFKPVSDETVLTEEDIRHGSLVDKGKKVKYYSNSLRNYVLYKNVSADTDGFVITLTKRLSDATKTDNDSEDPKAIFIPKKGVVLDKFSKEKLNEVIIECAETVSKKENENKMGVIKTVVKEDSEDKQTSQSGKVDFDKKEKIESKKKEKFEKIKMAIERSKMLKEKLKNNTKFTENLNKDKEGNQNSTASLSNAKESDSNTKKPHSTEDNENNNNLSIKETEENDENDSNDQGSEEKKDSTAEQTADEDDDDDMKQIIEFIKQHNSTQTNNDQKFVYTKNSKIPLFKIFDEEDLIDCKDESDKLSDAIETDEPKENES